MSLADLLAQRRSASSVSNDDTPLEQPSTVDAVPPEAVPSLASGTEGSSSGDEPYGVAEVEHPSGICVYFQAGPKRLYRLREKSVAKAGFPDHVNPAYSDWKDVPSVSEILDVLEKGGLTVWAERIGVNAILELVRLGELQWVDG